MTALDNMAAMRSDADAFLQEAFAFCRRNQEAQRLDILQGLTAERVEP